MISKLWVKILYIFTLLVQLTLGISVCTLQYLTNKKAGVNHHIYYRKYQFENGIFSENNINYIKIIPIILMIISVYLLIKNRNKNKFLITQIIITLVFSMILYLIISSNYFINMLAYHYFIMFFSIILFIQIIILCITFKLFTKI
jgi:hypothetical protein